MSNEEFQAFCDKRFESGQSVVVRRLGPSMPGEFKATIKGIYGMKPFEMYIVEWWNHDQVRQFYPKGEFWPSTVIPKGCIDAI